jgi:hypothetical protein
MNLNEVARHDAFFHPPRSMEGFGDWLERLSSSEISQ